MWADIQPELSNLVNGQKQTIKTRLVEMVRECTDNFFEVCQGSFLSPPSTPLSFEKLKEPASEAHSIGTSEPHQSAKEEPVSQFCDPSLLVQGFAGIEGLHDLDFGDIMFSMGPVGSNQFDHDSGIFG
jgi:hypothetical protein